MDQLVKSIISQDVNQVRQLLKENPDLINLKTYPGDSVCELAQKTGNTLVELSILRVGKLVIKDPEELFYGLFSTISQEYFFSQYENGIEYMVWHCVSNKGEWPKELENLYSMNIETVQDIKYLLNKSGYWYTSENGLIPLATWKNEFT